MIDYRCEKCRVTGCKLWRQYQTIASAVELLCAPCAVIEQWQQNMITEQEVRELINERGVRKGRYGPTDQIGGLVPAVPTVEGDTFWGYTTVPSSRIDWWYSLPTYPPSTPEQIAARCTIFEGARGHPEIVRANIAVAIQAGAGSDQEAPGCPPLVRRLQ